MRPVRERADYKIRCDDARWEDVVALLVRELPGQFLGHDDEQLEIDELDIVNVLMLQDNYMCALINEGLIDLRLPIVRISILTKVRNTVVCINVV